MARFLQGSMVAALWVVGIRIRLIGSADVGTDRPLIVIANHQSMYDIPLLGWTFRRHHPKLIAKQELGRYLPSVS